MNAILVAGAALVGLPILLHLIMKQEPKRLSFPAFRFLTQRLKTNQRKLRLRHFVLLALRMLLIALFCLALYQPTLKSDRLNIRGEQPVATVLVVDTSPSMGYTANDRSRLDEARRRALEFLDELPDKSPVAVVTTDDPTGYWVDLADARRQIEKLDKPRGGGQPVTTALAHAYQLFTKVEAREAEDAEQLPKLVAVFTDRAAACWDASRAEDLKKLRDKLPDPKPAHAVVDVGADQPVNVGILSAEMKPQVIPANQPAVVTVSVTAAGPPDLPPADVTVVARLTGAGVSEKRQAFVPYGQSRAVTFEFRNLRPGLHQVEFSLAAPDRLMFDNTRFLTFKVGEARRVLTVSDDPASAVFWQAGLLAAKEPFGCLIVRPRDVKVKDGRTVVEYPEDPANPDGKRLETDLREFEAVCLLSVADPGEKTTAPESLWEKLRPYVEAGGKLVVIPGENASAEGYAAGGNLMPGTLKGVIDTRRLDPPPPKQTAPGWAEPRDGKLGVTWFLDEQSDRVIQHPMLLPFQDWKSKGNVDAVKNPRRAWRYWDVQPADGATVIVRYNDADKDAARHPAVLERGVPDPKEPTRIKGRAILLTTKMDPPDVEDESRNWNNYWEFEGSTWFSVFPWMVVRYAAGDTADANFNFPAGQSVTVPLPKGGVPRGTKVVVDGPGIAGADALIEVGDRQTELRLGPPRTSEAGNFVLSVDSLRPPWKDGFSLNAPADESTLDKVPAEGIEDLTGAGTVLPLDKDLKLKDVITVIIGAPIDLFPWLLIAVLLLLAAEGLVANRFYRKVR